MPYDVKIDRLPAFTLFDLKGSAKDLAIWVPDLLSFPTAPNTLCRADTMELCLIGPNRFLLRAPCQKEDTLISVLRPAEAPPEISIVRVSDTMTFFRIAGPDAHDVMSIGCPLDLHPNVFGADAVSYTQFFGLRALVLRCDAGFDCAVEQSFGDMVADYLARAMA